ncbi:MULTISPECIES: hypothetical protein [Cyanophyceae]|uniref:hypothetical protein n=1 Tax=Cyanophyceae TaxID=3028117 RepID=UPI00168865D5|nr:hypothetical protein [Trichocoleus sp. FACHB-40]MBD2005616.1 hypothetical protein [Trichocoleus sp. FACHB-40]
MSNGQYEVGRGTKVRVAVLNDCDRVFPESTVFTVATTAVLANATSITVTVAPATTRIIKAPVWLLFEDATGKQVPVKVTADIAAGATTLTILAPKRGIAIGATAPYPVLLRNRTNANLTSDDAQQDVMTFDNDGWKDQITTMLGNGVSANGYFSSTDPGLKSIMFARENFKELYLELELPKPGCDNTYTKGFVFRGFAGVQGVPIEIPSDNIMNCNLEFKFRGPVTTVEPT